jgi:hypothetical protein
MEQQTQMGVGYRQRRNECPDSIDLIIQVNEEENRPGMIAPPLASISSVRVSNLCY